MRLRTLQVYVDHILPRRDVLTGCEQLDARFEVLGAPYSLLSVSLSASQKLYTRRGTLVGVNGKAENVSKIRRAK